jgi:hypothetical protein
MSYAKSRMGKMDARSFYPGTKRTRKRAFARLVRYAGKREAACHE